MSRFKDRLWADLVRAYGADLAQMTQPPAQPRRRPRILAGTGIGLAAAGATVAVVLGTAGTVPAFAVIRNHDGSVTVSISRLEGIPAANAKLAALGYRARVVQVMARCGANLTLRGASRPGGPAQMRAGVRFDPRQVPAGRVLLIQAWRARGEVAISRAQVMRGRVPGCLPMMPPPLGLRGRFNEACCPALRPLTGRPGRFRQVLAGPCWNRHGERPYRQVHISMRPPTRSLSGHGATGTQVTVSCPAPAPIHGRGQSRSHRPR
jgi:hypothetical protein